MTNNTIHLGVSVEGQPAADERIPLLRQCPAALRFLSVEPLLGPVDLLTPSFESIKQWAKDVPWLKVYPDQSLVIATFEGGDNNLDAAADFWATAADHHLDPAGSRALRQALGVVLGSRRRGGGDDQPEEVGVVWSTECHEVWLAHYGADGYQVALTCHRGLVGSARVAALMEGYQPKEIHPGQERGTDHDLMIDRIGEEATTEIRRAQRQRDEEQAARLRAETNETLMQLAFEGALHDLRKHDEAAAERHLAKMRSLFAQQTPA